VQNDSKLWADADKFNPSRFFEREGTYAKASYMANPNDLSRFDFLPFGHGRYSCPGNVFAMNEMLLFLSMMFHNFAMRLVNIIPSADCTKLVTSSAWGIHSIMSCVRTYDSFPGWRSARCASRSVSHFSCPQTAIVKTNISFCKWLPRVYCKKVSNQVKLNARTHARTLSRR
jgi:hypothetical protein